MAALLLLAGVGIRLSLVGYGSMDDAFHEGEYFTSAPSLLSGSPEPVFTVHGALDFVPALLAARLYGTGHHFFATKLLYALADVAAALLLYVSAILLTRRSSNRASLMPLLAAGGAFLFVGYRDLFALSSLVLFLACQQTEHRSRRIALEVALGITAAISLFWSFDRGLATTVAIGSACLALAVLARHFLPALVAFAVSVIALGQMSGQFSLGFHIANIRLLVGTAAEFGVAPRPAVIAFKAALTLLAAAAVGALAWLVRTRRGRPFDTLATPVALALMVPFFWKIGTYRADAAHFWMGLWLPGLALAYVWSETTERPSVSNRARQAAGWALAALLLRSWLQAAETRTMLLPPALGQLVTPPGNELLVGNAVRWASSELTRAGAPCIFDFSNNGLISGVTGLPTCSRFAYPLYATVAYEDEIIESLRRSRPPVVVHSAAAAASAGYAIDGRPMDQRLPRVAAYLRSAYPVERCRHGFCLRYATEQSSNRSRGVAAR